MAKQKKHKIPKRHLNNGDQARKSDGKTNKFLPFADLNASFYSGNATSATIAPAWMVYLILAWYPLVALMSVYGHKFGYSPDLHMSSLIQFGGVAFLAALLFTHARRGLAIYMPVVMLPAILFLLWAALSMLWAVNEYEAMVKILDWGGAILAGLLVAHTVRHPDDVRAFLNIVIAVGVCLLFLGYMQYFFDVHWVDQHAPPSMTFNNKNMAAQYTLLFLPIGIGMGLSARSWWAMLLYFSFSLVSVLFILLTVTRGAILGMGAEWAVLIGLLTIYALKHNMRSVQAVIGVLLALLFSGFFMVYLFFPGILESIVANFAKIFTNYQEESRYPIWTNTLAMIREYPMFGVGAGNWMVYYPKYHLLRGMDIEVGLHRQHINAHQDYLEMFSELGLVGFVFLLWLLVAAIWIALRLLFLMRSKDVFLVIAMISAMSGLMVNSLVSFGMQQPLPICMFMIYAALIDYYWRAERNKDARWIFKTKRVINAPTAIASIVCVLIFTLHFSWYRSELHYRQALVSRERVNEMLYHGEQALRWAPGRTRALNFVAKSYSDRGDREESLKSYRRLISDYPYMLHALDSAAVSFKRYGLREEARDTYKRLLAVRPTPTTYARIGQQLYTMGFTSEGVEYIRYALRNGGRGVERHYPGHEGIYYERAQQLTKFIEQYDAQVAVYQEKRQKALTAQQQAADSEDINGSGNKIDNAPNNQNPEVQAGTSN